LKRLYFRPILLLRWLDLAILGSKLARIFLSHSSQNNAAAIALRDWIIAGGWDEHPFLDLDPQRGIAAGERWETALHEAADRCEAVLFLVSKNWLTSDWCLKEFNLAQKLNKRLFGVLIDDLPLSELPSTLTTTWQVINLAAGNDHILLRADLPDLSKEEYVTFSRSGLARLKVGLDKAGLDPRFFAWPPENEPNRAPYPGLPPVEAEDAGIFFGREAPTVIVLDRLRGLREAAPPRLLVILGASGTGKSSFLRAGLIPRLARDDTNFLPLQIIRPETAAITGKNGLIYSLQKACEAQGLPLNRAYIAAAVEAGAAQLLPLLIRLAEKARAPDVFGDERPAGPSLILSVDQGEELFLAEGASEAQSFLALLNDLLLAASPNLIVLFTIRSDTYERLQTAKALEGVRQDTFGLPPMPRGAYQTIIEGPAQRLKDSHRRLTIEPALTQALLTDIEAGGGKDALPLLAFTLERLYREFGTDGDLTLKEYEALGRIAGSIQAAVDAALKTADLYPSIPRDPLARLALLRRALIPALAGIDPETGASRRRVATMEEIPAEAHGLINCLVLARLLTTDRAPATGETIVEPAHEALLRQWDALQNWLKEDSAALLLLEGVKQAARDWAAADRSGDWLTHSAGRLEDAERLRERDDFSRFFGPNDRRYIEACRAKDNASRNRELEEAQKLAESQRQIAKRTRLGLIAASILTALALGAAWFAFDRAREAKNETQIAQRNATEAEKQKANAKEQTLIAEQRKKDAEQQELKAEQRSARLAANAANSLATDGALDQSLLLMLNAAQWFDDNSVPDDIRIAFTKALQKKSRIEINKLFPELQVFETDAALFLVNRQTNDIFTVTNSLSPTRIFKGTPQDSQIFSLKQSVNRGDVVIVRENLDVQRLNLQSGSVREIGAFTKPLVDPKDVDETSNEEPKIWDDGLVVRTVALKTGDERHVQIIDAYTGQKIEVNLPDSLPQLGKLNGGGIFAFDGENKKAFRLIPSAGGSSIKEAVLTENQSIELAYGKCVAAMNELVRSTALTAIHDFGGAGRGFINGSGSQLICRKYAHNYLLTLIMFGSGGEVRSDISIADDGTKSDIRAELSDALISEGLPHNNFTAVVEWSDAESEEIAVISNRDIFVLDETEELVLHYRHPTAPSFASFLDRNHLAVVEPGSGQFVVHALGGEANDQDTIFSTGTRKIIGTDKPVPTLHHGTCVGFSVPRTKTDTLPDGRQVFYDVSSMSEGSDKNEIRVVTDKGTVILKFDAGVECVEFSADWKHLLVVEPARLSIFDFDRAVSAGTLSGSEIGALPFSLLCSAFFVGQSNDVITADCTNRVLLWKRVGVAGNWESTQLYNGEKPIQYAEPDREANRLLLTEEVGGDNLHGFLYSVRTKQAWFDLGTDYKWLGITFTDREEIVVSKHFSWANVFPILPLSALVDLANKELSPECRPIKERDYRNSRCWPSSFE
jgi:hypothetical protein